MNRLELQQLLRSAVGLRIGTHMADYIQGQLQSSRGQIGFFVMGGDARTGRPVRKNLTAAMLSLSSSQETTRQVYG